MRIGNVVIEQVEFCVYIVTYHGVVVGRKWKASRAIELACLFATVDRIAAENLAVARSMKQLYAWGE